MSSNDLILRCLTEGINPFHNSQLINFKCVILGDSHIKGRGCSSENSNWTAKEDQRGCGSSLNWPLREISVWSGSGHFVVNFFKHSTCVPIKQYLNGQIVTIWTSQTPQVRPKSAIYTPKRDDEHPRHFYMGFPPRCGRRGVREWMRWRGNSVWYSTFTVDCRILRHRQKWQYHQAKSVSRMKLRRKQIVTWSLPVCIALHM